jgi:hypothetical protein
VTAGKWPPGVLREALREALNRRPDHREEVKEMDYQKLYEKYAKGQRNRGYLAIVGGVINIAAGFMMLKQLRDEQQD